MPRAVWALGGVSLLMDVSSEMIHGLLPVFLVSVLGASALTVGIIEGVGEGAASITRVFSGWLSDRLGRRKGLAVAGYGLGALAKPLFALAPSAAWVLGARFVDRVGKGVRGAPRDALVADVAPPGLRGAAYGLRQSLDTVGALAGPLLAMVLMQVYAADFRQVFALAVVPGLAAVLLLVLAVREPPRQPAAVAAAPLRWAEVSRLGPAFWGVAGIGALLTLARFSEAFLLLRAQDAGLAAAWVPLMLVVMNAVYAASAWPVGAWSDRLGRHGLLAGGFGVLILADCVLAFVPSVAGVLTGAALWGLHMGMTQGLLAALVADAAPVRLRGTAFGVFHFASGIALLLASVVAGALWERAGPQATFLAGAAFTVLGLLGMLALAARRTRIAP